MTTMGGYIYFIQAEESKRIKIGYASKPNKRLKGLQTGSPEKLLLVKQIEGDKAGEALLHARFRIHRINGEWFYPANELLKFIDECKGFVVETHTQNDSEIELTWFKRVMDCDLPESSVVDFPSEAKEIIAKRGLTKEELLFFGKKMIPEQMAKDLFGWHRDCGKDALASIKDIMNFNKFFIRNLPHELKGIGSLYSTAIYVNSPESWGIASSDDTDEIWSVVNSFFVELAMIKGLISEEDVAQIMVDVSLGGFFANQRIQAFDESFDDNDGSKII